jgi:regulator of cell morphogenesis and NO signaling
MLSLHTEPTVAEIAASSLAAVKVFERLGVDYCCGGKRPLADVCAQKGLDAAAVTRELEAAMSRPDEEGRDWNTAPLADLITHIEERHHAFLRRELPAIATRLEKVYRVYNQRYGETLPGLPEVFNGLQEDLLSHIVKEERILFPAIKACEKAAAISAPLPYLPFGTIANPIRMMEMEHDGAGSALVRIREITDNFAIPEHACVTYRALIAGLEELESDLHLHIHLENNILFPRAIELSE